MNHAFQQKTMQSAPVQSFSFQNINHQPVQRIQSVFPTLSNTYPMIQHPFMSMYTHGRKKRSSDADWISASELKELWTYKVSNLTCFMKGVGVIDDNYNIQKNFLKTKVWEMKDLRATEHLSDPVWRNKVSQQWVDCADIAEAIPEQALDNCPMTRMFGPLGRCMKFMMCKKEVTEAACGMAQAEKLQRRYHPNCLGGTGASVLGVRDRYEEAMACAMTMMHSKYTEDMTGKFVKKAIRGEL